MGAKKGASKEAPFSVALAIISKEVIEEIPGIGVVAVAAIAVPAVTIVAVVGALVGGTRLRRLGGCIEGELYLDRLTLAVDGQRHGVARAVALLGRDEVFIGYCIL